MSLATVNSRWPRWLAAAALVAVVLSGSWWRRTYNLVVNGESYYFGIDLPDWSLAAPTLEPLISQADVVITTNFLMTEYSLGRFDYTFSPTAVYDVTGEEWGIDERTGKPIISEFDSLRFLVEGHRNGIILGEQREWRSRWRITGEAADYIEAMATPVELPPDSGLFAYAWRRSENPEAPSSLAPATGERVRAVAARHD